MDANVPVGGIYTAADIAADPHYQARESYVTVEDPRQGPVPMSGVIPKLTGTPGRIESTGPELGQHNDEIYRDLLGKSADELARLAVDEVI